MEYIEAGKFIKSKRKSCGFKTQKSFIAALEKNDPEINCSESYISLIESGVKSPSLHLLDVMATVLDFTQQEKGELLLIYKRVPNDFELTVRSNLKDSLRVTSLDLLKKKYDAEKNNKNLNNLIRALVFEGKSEEAIDFLKNAPEFSFNLVELQDRTAKIAAISGNYDFAIQAFNLALESCADIYAHTKADILMNIGVCYFNKALKINSGKSFESINFMIQAKEYFEKSMLLWSDYIYCLDEYARCLYHIADTLDYFKKNNIKLESSSFKYLETEIDKNKDLQITIDNFFNTSLEIYKKIISHTEKGDLLEKALKEAVYFHAYAHCKLKKFDEALILINMINILDQNWLTFFLKAGYFVLRYEHEKNDTFLSEAIENLSISFEYEPESIKSLIKTERDRELKTLWELKPKEMNKFLEGKS